MLQHTFLHNGKSSFWYEIHKQEDLQKYIDFAEALAHSEFRALVTMTEQLITHNTWKSPITNLTIRMAGYGKPTMQAFADNEASYVTSLIRGLRDEGVIFINSDGGYNYTLDTTDAVKTIEIDKVEANLLTIDTSSTNLVLENDTNIDSDLEEYLSHNDIPYSSITQLRLAVQNGDLMRGIRLVMGVHSHKKFNLYVKTTAMCVEQIWTMLDKLQHYIAEIHVSLPDNADELFENLKQDYPSIKFFRLDLELSKL